MRLLHFPTANFDQKPAQYGDDFGELPEWNLDDLYRGEDAPELVEDWKFLEQEIPNFAADYQGNLENLNGDEWLNCTQRLEKIQSIQGPLQR